MSLLKIESLKKSFGKTRVLKGLDLEVQEGEIISVLGPSGCGKSTLLRIIAGILPLDEGVVSIKGNVVSSVKKEVATEYRDINMVFQDFALWPHMSVEDNILYGLKIKKISNSEMLQRLSELISLLHLEGLMKRYPAELSGGQQQRVAIARALITKPSIVLLDEPLCNLDIQLRVEMRTEMAYLFHQLKTTVFHVTHDPSEAFAMADRIIIMNQGEIDQMDTPIHCYRYPKTPTVAGLLGANNQLNNVQIESIDGDMACVMVGDDVLRCKSFIQDQKDVLQLRFRPESGKFSHDKQTNSIQVTIMHATFEGSCYRVKGTLSNGDTISFLHHEAITENTLGYVSVPDDAIYAYSKDLYE